jgi:hypothetical protein
MATATPICVNSKSPGTGIKKTLPIIELILMATTNNNIMPPVRAQPVIKFSHSLEIARKLGIRSPFNELGEMQ